MRDAAVPQVCADRRNEMTSMTIAAPTSQYVARNRPGRVVYAGVDTYKELHVAAVIDAREIVFGTRISSGSLV